MGKTNYTMAAFRENQPRNTSDIEDSSKSTASVEVGVIIMGMSCVCVVACALIILQVRSVNRQRQRRRRQRSSTVSIMMDGEDPYQSFAPPTYEAVIRSPHLYPPSPRSSVVSVTSISSTRRASSTSNLSKVSATAFSSATQEQSTSVMIEDLEDPPPPYPGIIASTYTDLDVQIHSRTNDAYFHRNSCHGNTEERDDISRNINNVDENAPENQINYNNLQTSITSINIPVNSRRNRSSSHGNVLQRDTRLPNHRHHRNSVHSIGGNHSDHAHKSSCPGSNRRSCSGRASRSGRARSVSFVLSPNFLLLPTQAWDQYPRELSFVCCQSNSPHLGTRPSQ